MSQNGNNPYGNYQTHQQSPYGMYNTPNVSVQNRPTMNNWMQAQNQQQILPSFPQQPIQQTYNEVIPPLYGRAVNSQNDIKNNEVPQNGIHALFPTNDEEYIYVKYLDKDCNIKTVVYKRTDEESSVKSDPIEEILERLNAIENKMNQQKTYNQQYNNRKNQQKDGDQS